VLAIKPRAEARLHTGVQVGVEVEFWRVRDLWRRIREWLVPEKAKLLVALSGRGRERLVAAPARAEPTHSRASGAPRKSEDTDHVHPLGERRRWKNIRLELVYLAKSRVERPGWQ
jgi:hypothetical protein